MGDTRSTPQSRVRTANKQISAAQHRLRAARQYATRLAQAEARLASLCVESPPLPDSDSPRHGGYSRSEIKRALALYLADGDPLSSDPQPLAVRDVEGRYGDDDQPDGAETPEPSWSLHVTSRPRSRNVFGERMSWSRRGRKNRGPLPRGAGPQPARMVRRADLQLAMRQTPVRSAEVAFLRGVLDWQFTDIAAHYGYSKQAARKAYAKALLDLQTALNGTGSEAAQHAEFLALEAELSLLGAERRYWLRQAMALEARLAQLREALPALQADARGDRVILASAAA